MYFPQVLSWFGSVDSVLVWRFLEQWPDLGSLRKARRSTLKSFLERDGRCSPPEIEELWPTVRNAIPATQDAAVIATSILFVKTIVRQLQLLHEAIREYDKRIEQVTETHPDFPLVRSFPGVGEGTRATTDRRAGHAARPNFAAQVNCRAIPGLHPYRSPAANSVRFMCVGLVRSLCGKHFRNGHSTLYLVANGLGRITTSNVRAANTIMRLFVAWRSNGFAFSIAASRIILRTRKLPT